MKTIPYIRQFTGSRGIWAALTLATAGKTSALLDRRITKVKQLGTTETIVWSRGDDALTITPASAKLASAAAVVFKITLR